MNGFPARASLLTRDKVIPSHAPDPSSKPFFKAAPRPATIEQKLVDDSDK